MRITFVARRSWPAKGGAEMLMHHVVRALASDHDVTVLVQRIDDGPTGRKVETLGQPPLFDPFRDGNAEVRQLRVPPRNKLPMLPVGLQCVPGFARFAYGRMRIPLAAVYARAMESVLVRNFRDTDVVHAWSADLLGAAALRAARAAGRPFVITPFVHPGQWGDDPASVRVYRQSDAVIGLLDAERPVFHELSVNPQRVHVCGACTPGVAGGGGDAIRVRHGISGPLIVFLGVRRPYKGYELLLDAADAVRDVHPNVAFAFVGPGSPIDVNRTRARVIDVGAVDDAGVAGWLDAADLMCLPSSHEIFPTSALEAFSVKTPVLLSDLPPLEELIAKSGGGAVTERTPRAVADGILRMLASPDRLAATGAAGYEFWSSKYTPEAVASHHEHIYGGLFDRAGRASCSTFRDPWS